MSATADWTRLVRFVAVEDHAVHFGEPVDASQDVGLAVLEGKEVKVHEIVASNAWDQNARVDGKKVLTVEKLLSPIDPSTTGAIRAIGLNYRSHADEVGLPYPSIPVLFLKPHTTLTDPGAQVTIPLMAQADEVDWEVELAVVIGKEAKDVSEEEALQYVLGYTVANDLSARKVQFASSQWCHGKVFDGFNPLGPTLVSSRAIPDPQVLDAKTHVNGTLKQNGTTSDMIFSVAHIVSFLSQGSTLPAGTVIITGTPPGVGTSYKPAQWLKHGDDVRCWISHGLGTLQNGIMYQPHPSSRL